LHTLPPYHHQGQGCQPRTGSFHGCHASCWYGCLRQYLHNLVHVLHRLVRLLILAAHCGIIHEVCWEILDEPRMTFYFRHGDLTTTSSCRPPSCIIGIDPSPAAPPPPAPSAPFLLPLADLTPAFLPQLLPRFASSRSVSVPRVCFFSKFSCSISFNCSLFLNARAMPLSGGEDEARTLYPLAHSLHPLAKNADQTHMSVRLGRGGLIVSGRRRRVDGSVEEWPKQGRFGHFRSCSVAVSRRGP
jgi:hypothetical protein